MTRADLMGANLAHAYLTDADLTDANLAYASLTKADLTKADLTGADLTWADLTSADLTCAHLTGADLTRADLTWANLTDAGLTGAHLTGADLTGTVLDPRNAPNQGDDETEWETKGEYLIGYRTRHQPYQCGPDYEDGREYIAPVFSTCEATGCHPGLYVCREDAEVGGGSMIQVRFARKDLHSAGGKHRVRRFTVLSKVLGEPVPGEEG